MNFLFPGFWLLLSLVFVLSTKLSMVPLLSPDALTWMLGGIGGVVLWGGMDLLRIVPKPKLQALVAFGLLVLVSLIFSTVGQSLFAEARQMAVAQSSVPQSLHRLFIGLDAVFAVYAGFFGAGMAMSKFPNRWVVGGSAVFLAVSMATMVSLQFDAACQAVGTQRVLTTPLTLTAVDPGSHCRVGDTVPVRPQDHVVVTTLGPATDTVLVHVDDPAARCSGQARMSAHGF